jgi:tetratricopeptide (TPR) repeat protein
MNLGVLLKRTGRTKDAEEAYRRCLEIRERLADDFPAWPDYRDLLASIHNNLALLFEATKQPAKAEEHFRTSIGIREKLADEFPKLADNRQNLAVRGYFNLGKFLQNTDRLQDAADAYRQTVVVQEKLVAEFPELPMVRRELCNSRNFLGLILRRIGRTEDAEAAFRKALEELEQLGSEFPTAFEYQSDWGGVLNNLGRLCIDANRLAEARRLLDQAVLLQRAALNSNPRHPTYRRYLNNHYVSLIPLLLRLGEHATAAATVEQWVELVPENYPDDLWACNHLMRWSNLVGKDSALSPDQREAAREPYSLRARKLLRESAGRHANDHRALTDIARTLANSVDARIFDPVEAIELARKATTLAPSEGATWNTLGVAYYRAGEWKLAIQAMKESMPRRAGGGDSSEWFVLAMAHWRLGEKDEARQWYDRGVQCLEKYKDRLEGDKNRLVELRCFRAEAEELLEIKKN